MSARRKATQPLLWALALGLLPGVAHACSVCGGGNPANRFAFFMSTIVLSLLPLGLIAGGLWWVRSRLKHTLADEFRDRDETTPASAPESPTPEATPDTP